MFAGLGLVRLSILMKSSLMHFDWSLKEFGIELKIGKMGLCNTMPMCWCGASNSNQK